MITSEKSRFYCPEERKLHGNGNKYDLTVDNIITQTLYYNKPLNKGQLESKLEEAFDKSHIRSCSDRINDLVDHGILSKVDHGRGLPVEYSLTEDAIKQVQLNLIGVPIDTSMLFRKIYQTILFNDISESLPIRVESEEDFDKVILAELHVHKSELRWGRIATSENFDSVDIIYPTLSMDDRQVIIRKYWKERKGESTVLEEIEFICHPFASKGELDPVLKKIEYWQINKYSENIKYRQEYLCELPGFSIDEILASKRFKDNAVNFAFNALQELKLIEPNIEFQGKTRFIIPDKKLHRLLVNMWVIHDAEFSCLIEKWEFFDKPTVKEENRMERLLGKQEAHRLFRKLHSARSQHNLELRKFATSEEYHQHIKKRCSSYLEELAWDATLEEFKFKIRGDRRIVTKKEKRGDILMYVNFMKAKLYDSLERLPVDHVDDNMEDFRMEYRETLRKYSFFRPVLKEICPKAFEADHDSESTLGEQNESLIKKRQSGIVIHIKGIRGKENKRSSSRGKKIVKIPYEWMKMHDHENNIDKEYPVFDLTNI